jgi:hypothetical protein
MNADQQKELREFGLPLTCTNYQVPNTQYELLKNQSVSDTTYHWGVLKLGEQGVIDLTALVGYYSMLALVLNMARTPLPQGDKPALALFPR